MSKITSLDGTTLMVSSNGPYVLLSIVESKRKSTSAIWLSVRQSDELIRNIAAVRVELSKARPRCP